MTPPPCFACRVRAAGNDYAGSYSAYCLEHQPHDQRPVLGGAFACPVGTCLEQFGRQTDWVAHQIVDYSKPSAITCLPPSTLPGEPLIRDSRGVWQTEKGLRKRALGSEHLRAAREGRNTP